MSDSPSLIIVMGVSGSGKTTLGKVLAESLCYDFIDADDFHSEQAKNKWARMCP